MISLVSVAIVLCSQPSFAQKNLPSWETPFVEGDLIVMLQAGVSPDAVVRAWARYEGHETGINLAETLSDGAGIYLYRFDHNACDQYALLESIRGMREVVAAQFNHFIEQRLVPSDPQFGSQWHHIDGTDNDIDTDLAWNITTGGNTGDGHNVVACVVEWGGINWAHGDLAANHWVNPHEIADDGIDNDGNGRIDDFDGWCSSCGTDNIPAIAHGTACMGMLGATANNGNGGAGVCWNTDLMAVTFTPLTESNVVAAYDYPYDMRVQYNSTNGALGAFVTVMSSSWGVDNANPASFPIWCAFYDTMGNAGILNCAATTNNNANVDVVGDMPTGCGSQYLIAVTATNSSDVRTSAGFGATSVDLAAPGVAVWIPNLSSYSTQSGTSFATPCVAGAVALLYSLPSGNLGALGISSPGSTALMVKNAILNGVDPVPGLSGFVATGGRLNVFNALNLLAASITVPGCTDPAACNFDPSATENDGSCIYSDAITITMSDSFGDSWNGAVYQIHDSSGNLVLTGTHAGGATSSNTICLSAGCYTISVTSGAFPGEIGWALTGADNPLSGGAPVSGLSFSVGQPYGCMDIAACNYDPVACIEDGSCCYSICADISVTSGIFPSEISWTLLDPFGASVLSGGAPFVGSVCLEYPCEFYTLNMLDAFGDGWDAAEFTISVPGIWSFSTSLTSGVSGAADFFTGVSGCTNPLACNFDPAASCDNGGCIVQDFVTLTMTDSFGDSWNGAVYQIYDSTGSLVLTGTHGGGPTSSNSICLSAGCYTISVTSGIFPGEIGWTLTSSDGTISGGAPVTELSFTVGAPFGCTDITACNFSSDACVDDGSCCYNNCLYLYQEDSFGDGWDAAEFIVFDYSGAEVLSATLEYSGGFFGFDLLCLPTGCYTYQVTGGAFPAEVAWVLVGAQDGVLSGEANVSGSFVVGNPTFGCTDPGACNYDATANCSDASCVYCLSNCLVIGMYDSFGDGWNGAQYLIYDAASNLVASGTTDPFTTVLDMAGICLEHGCYNLQVTGGSFPSEIFWILYLPDGGITLGYANSNVYFEVGSLVAGCLDPLASNYNPAANCDNGNCTYSCSGDFDYNGVVNVADLLLLISAFGCTSSCNSLFDVAPNGVINTSDLLVFVSAFGTTCP